MDKPFLRTTQSFQQDNFSYKRWLSVGLLLLYILWLVWFCVMPIGKYETASNIQVIETDEIPTLRATFDDTDFRVGQTVELHSNNATFNATVQTIESADEDGMQVVEFQVKNLPDNWDKDATLAVKLGSTTPLQYLFDQIGQDF